jgi:hypothetical protein
VFLGPQDIGRSINAGLYRLRDDTSLELDGRKVSYASWKSTLSRSAVYQWLLEHSHLAQVVRQAIAAREARNGPDRGQIAGWKKPIDLPEAETRDRSDVRLGRALFARLQHWCEDRAIDLWVCTNGFDSSLRPGADGTPTARFLQVCDVEFRDRGIPYRNLYPEVLGRILANIAAYRIEDDDHPNEEGAELIARAAWNWISPLLEEHLATRR